MNEQRIAVLARELRGAITDSLGDGKRIAPYACALDARGHVFSLTNEAHAPIDIYVEIVRKYVRGIEDPRAVIFAMEGVVKASEVENGSPLPEGAIAIVLVERPGNLMLHHCPILDPDRDGEDRRPGAWEANDGTQSVVGRIARFLPQNDLALN